MPRTATPGSGSWRFPVSAGVLLAGGVNRYLP